MIYVYVIDSLERNYLYVGQTNNIIRRLQEHNGRLNKTTSPYAPFRTILVEQFVDRQNARQREKYLKGGSGKEFLKRLR